MNLLKDHNTIFVMYNISTPAWGIMLFVCLPVSRSISQSMQM